MTLVHVKPVCDSVDRSIGGSIEVKSHVEEFLRDHSHCFLAQSQRVPVAFWHTVDETGLGRFFFKAARSR